MGSQLQRLCLVGVMAVLGILPMCSQSNDGGTNHDSDSFGAGGDADADTDTDTDTHTDTDTETDSDTNTGTDTYTDSDTGVDGCVTIPARVEAEEYVAFFESDTVNAGIGCDREDGVDLETTQDPAGGDCNVGWTVTDEWLEYCVYAKQSGNFNITARMASDVPNSTIRIEIDGTDVTGSVAAPVDGWQVYSDVSAGNVALIAGTHTVRVVQETGNVNLNWFDFGAGAADTDTDTVHTPKPFMDYIKPRPITCDSLSSDTWGVDGVLPRDLCNGIESARGAGVPPEYYYWDGQILKAQDGKYHMFMSTWSGTTSFNPGWLNSDAYHAISAQGVLGPYERVDYVYNNNGSHKGHNVTALELPNGDYAVVVSETVPFTIYTSRSLDGPWTSCQPRIDVGSSNVSLVARHDGRYQVVERYGNIAIADSLCGHYVKQVPACSYPTDNNRTIYPTRDAIPRVDNPTFEWQEDPHIWRSGGVYHVIYSGSGDRVGWHLYSKDGINDWQDNGYAWSPREWERIFCFGDGSCNQWYKMERPGVVLENGHPTHLTWAVSDVNKDYEIPGNSNHGSKIIVVPFDGVAFDADFATK